MVWRLLPCSREDDPAPETEIGTRFAAFFDMSFNGADQLVFGASLRGDSINASNDIGIWALDRNGELQLIVRAGDTINVGSGDTADERVVSQLGMSLGTGNEDGRRSSFNDKGQVAFAALFTDGSSGVFVSDKVASLSLPGDFNGDGLVDAADYTVWRDGLGATYGQSHYGDWKNNFGVTTAGGSRHTGDAIAGFLTGEPPVPTAAVPEPGSLPHLLLALGALLQRRRRP